MPQKPKALVVDDGELEIARVVLNHLGVPFWHLRAATVHGPLPPAERLLVIPARLAVSFGVARTRPKPGEPPTWMAFVPAESKSQRRLLRQAGFDYTVPENVHPAALRLLMARALFQGENTQRVTRVPYGAEISYVTTLRRHRAVLVDISPRGCRFLTRKAPKEGSKITVQIPCGHETPLQLPGAVVRACPGAPEGGQAHEISVGLRFDPISGQKREQLKALLIERLAGPMTFGSGERVHLPDEDASVPDACTVVEEDRESALYERRVDAFYAGTTKVLVGRDLSEQGMRVDKRGEFEVGERLRLALPVDDNGEPLMIEAHVAHDEGDRIVLLFDWMEPRSQERLKELLQRLPRIHRLQDDTRTHTAVPAAVVNKLRRR